MQNIVPLGRVAPANTLVDTHEMRNAERGKWEL